MNANEAYLNFHRFQQSREKFYAPKFYKALKAQYQEFIKALQAGKSQTDSLMAISAVPISIIIKGVYIDAGTIYGAKIAAYLPKRKIIQKSRARIGFNERMIELINLYFETDILNTSEGITQTTREIIQVILEIANEEGRSIEWIVDELENEASNNLNRTRSRLIARTETVTGANMGGFIAALDTGLMMNKEWLATGDNRTRLDHVAVNSIRIGMLDYFNVGTNTMLFPGDRIQQNGQQTSAKEVCNCRCTLLFIPVRVDGKLVDFDYSQFRNLLLTAV